MTVYLLVHDEGYGAHVRGVYASREAAKAHRVDRTPSGQRSRSWDAHNEDCCQVEEWEVESA